MMIKKVFIFVACLCVTTQTTNTSFTTQWNLYQFNKALRESKINLFDNLIKRIKESKIKKLRKRLEKSEAFREETALNYFKLKSRTQETQKKLGELSQRHQLKILKRFRLTIKIKRGQKKIDLIRAAFPGGKEAIKEIVKLKFENFEKLLEQARKKIFSKLKIRILNKQIKDFKKKLKTLRW